MAGKFELKQAKNGDFYFNLLAGSEQIILTSEMYKSKASAENGIASVAKNAAEEARYERLTATNGKAYFVLKAGNHQIIGQSKMFDTDTLRDDGIAAVKQYALGANTEDLTG